VVLSDPATRFEYELLVQRTAEMHEAVADSRRQAQIEERLFRTTPWSRLLSNPKLLARLLMETYDEWSSDKAPRMGAALAYYTIFSLAPLLVIVIAVAGFFLGTEAVEEALVTEMQGFVGPDTARAIQRIISASFDPGSGALATVVAVILLLFGSTVVFAEMRDALNTIWEMKPRPESTVKSFLKTRIFSLSMVLCVGFLLLVSLLLSTLLAFAARYWRSYLPLPPLAMSALDLVLSFGLITVLFAMLFKILPAAKIAWRDVWMGALITSFLFTVGKFLIGLYLGTGAVASSYGAAASVVVIAAWTYYSAQIFYFGAEMTHVYTSHYRRYIEPEENAVRASKAKDSSRV
jgi:membrane protein